MLCRQEKTHIFGPKWLTISKRQGNLDFRFRTNLVSSVLSLDLKQKDVNLSDPNSVVDPLNPVEPLPVEDSGDGGERGLGLEVRPGPGRGLEPDGVEPDGLEPDGGEGYFDAISPAHSLDDWVRRELGDLE